jgi:type IV secretory pathway protease TraF
MSKKQMSLTLGSFPKPLVRLLMSLTLGSLALVVLSRFFVVNLTPSMPLGLYLIRSDKPIVGDLVIFPETALPERWRGRIKYKRLLKRLVSDEAGRSYVLGDHPRSFDSRIYGTIESGRLRRVTPLWVKEAKQ